MYAKVVSTLANLGSPDPCETGWACFTVLLVLRCKLSTAILLTILVLGACDHGVDLTETLETSNPATSSTSKTPPTTITIPSKSSSDTGGTPSEVGTPGLGDSFYPLLGNGGYDALHYQIELDINPSTNIINAQTTMTARATQNLAAFNLDFSGLTVDAITVNDQEVAFSRQGAELTTYLTELVEAGDEFITTVHYSGEPETITDPGVPFTQLGWNIVNGAIFTVNQPSAAMTWYPANHHPTDKATFEFRLIVPSSLTAAATGVLVEETNHDDRTTTTWQMTDPMSTYLAAVYVGDFERVENRQADGLLIRDYIPRECPDIGDAGQGCASQIREALAITPEVIDYFESLLGPYPFDAYGTIVMPFPLGFALENQTLSIHGIETLTPEIIAHEIVHQWIGNSSTAQDWSEIWLHEGFATYLSHMYLDEFHDIDINTKMRELETYMAAIDAVPPNQIHIEQMFDISVYERGALTLHALRGFVGDDAFNDILRTHYQRSIHSNTTIKNFLDTVTQLGGTQAASLVGLWLNDPMSTLEINNANSLSR